MKYDESESRDDKVKRIPIFNPDTSNWPNSIRTVSPDDFEMMAVDVHGRLYWDGKLIKIAQLTLSSWQKVAGVVIAISAFVGALIPAWIWGCELGWVGVCPIPPLVGA